MADQGVEIVIVGAGALGCGMAHTLAKAGRQVMVLEKNAGVSRGENQSSRNSGVIHAGIYYDRETRPLKAALCAKGAAMLYDYCRAHRVPHFKCGKLVMGHGEADRQVLEMYHQRAAINGAPTRIIERDEAAALEPNALCQLALLASESGVIEPTSLVRSLHANAEAAGAVFVTGAELCAVDRRAEALILDARRPDGAIDQLAADLLINCAGLFSDEVARLVNPASPYRIDPMRGEAMWFRRGKRPELEAGRMNVYPTPHRVELPGGVYWTVGVHLTPTVEPADATGTWRMANAVSVGPLNFAAKDKNDYGGDMRPSADFAKKVQGFFPQLLADDLQPYQVGIQARLAGCQDWVIQRDDIEPRCINLLGIDSPGLTSCLAIAEHVLGMLD